MKDFMRNIKNINIIKIDKKKIINMLKKTFFKNKTSNNTYNKVFFIFIYFLLTQNFKI